MTKAGKSRDGGGDKSLALYIYESVLRKVRNTIKEWCFGKKRDEKFVRSSCNFFRIF